MIEDIISKYDPALLILFPHNLDILSRYDKAKTLEERVAILYRYLQVHRKDLFEIDITNMKSSEYAKACRVEGNAEFTKSNTNLTQALLCYTKSIAAAPYPASENDDSNDLAIAFANRSAVLFAMGKYNECTGDITQTLKFQYPDTLKYKVFMRKGECLQIMGRAEEAMESFEVSCMSY